MQFFRPLAPITVSQWADNYRYLSPEYCAEPGRWRTSRVEYSREIMDSLTDPTVEQTVVVAGSQISKTEILVNVIGYFADRDPAPILLVVPRETDVKMFSSERLAPTIRDTPALRTKFSAAKSRDSGNTIAFKKFPGGNIAIVGANAPSNLASRPRRIILSDEDDRQGESAGVEGDPWQLAWTRTKTYSNRKGYRCSTPVRTDTSRILRAFAETDQRFYHIPCPRCGELHRLEWANLIWEKKPDNTPNYRTVRARCPHCSGLYSNAEKDAAVSDRNRARWIPTAPFNGQRGYRINALYSPFPNSTFEKIVRQWHEAKGDPNLLQTFYNTVLGEPYDGISDEVSETEIASRIETYRAPVPRHVLYLSAGFDTQNDRVEVEVVGWNDAGESWSIEYHVFPGDPKITEGQLGSPWDAVTELLQKKYRHELGFEIPISAAAIDTGGTNYITQDVYAYCYLHRFSIMPLRGATRADADPIKFSRIRFGKNKSRHVFLCYAGVHKLKGIVMGRLKIPESGPGYCHFPDDRDKAYFEQLTAEHLVTVIKRNTRVAVWQKKHDSDRNEALDCRVYAYAALLAKAPRWEPIKRRHAKLAIAAYAAAQKAKSQTTNDELPHSAEPPAQDPASPIVQNATASNNTTRPRRRAGGWMSSYRR